MKALIRILFIIPLIIVACTKAEPDENVPDNTRPMYGGVKKSAKFRALDNEFIADAVKMAGGDRNLASRQYVEAAWDYYYNKSDAETAMKRFNQAWLLNNQNPDVFLGFGVLWGNKFGPDSAIRYFDLGLATDSSHFDLKLNIAGAYLSKFDNYYEKDIALLDLAKKHLEELFRVKPQEPMVIERLALLYYLYGDYPQAWKYVHLYEKTTNSQMSAAFVNQLSYIYPDPGSNN